MPHEIEVSQLPGGIVLQAAKAGEFGTIQDAGAATSDDGEALFQYLNFAENLLDQLRQSGHAIATSQVDNFLAIIRRDRTTTLYINELPLVSTIRISRACEAGEPISTDDVVDFAESRLGDISVSPDAGFITIVSYKWRKGVLFDFAPLRAEDPPLRDYELWPVLGQIVARLMFQERLNISREDWKQLFANRWFPFAGLRNGSIEKLLGHVRAGWGLNELLPDFKIEINSKIGKFLESWTKKEQFSGHTPFLERAIERFEEDDYVSCTSIMFPVIEGILRAHHAIASPNTERKQQALSASAVASVVDNPYSLLLPRRFQSYLRQVFFAGFDDKSQGIPVSRNSVGHGIASPNDFTLETALLGILICHQLFYCFPPDRK